MTNQEDIMQRVRKDYLLAPGPTPVPAEVLQAGALPIYHHRTPKFSKIVHDVSEDLKYLFQTKNDVYTLTSSGTGAMETAVVNLLSPGDKAIVIEGGKFGERWTKILKTYGMNPEIIKVPYGEFVTPEKLEETLKTHSDAKAVFTQLSETSTGVVYDTKGFGEVVSKTDAVLVVDGISGIGATELRCDDWNVDIALTGSQKGLMLPPGLAFISASDKAWKLIETSTCPKFYYSLKDARKSLEKDTTPWTPALTIILQLKEAMTIIKNETIEGMWQRHAWLANATRNAVGALELELFAKRPGNVLTSVKVPQGVDGAKLVKTIRDKFGVTFAGGQGTMKGNIFRIAHLGYMDRMDVIIAIAATEMALKEAGYPVKMGAGVAAAEEALINDPF